MNIMCGVELQALLELGEKGFGIPREEAERYRERHRRSPKTTKPMLCKFWDKSSCRKLRGCSHLHALPKDEMLGEPFTHFVRALWMMLLALNVDRELVDQLIDTRA